MTYRLQGIFGAIADPHRRQILDYLMVSDLTAGELARKFAISRPAVTKHLRVLEDNDLIRVTRRGRERIHRLNPEPLLTVSQWVSRYERFWDANLSRLKALVEAPHDEPNGEDTT